MSKINISKNKKFVASTSAFITGSLTEEFYDKLCDVMGGIKSKQKKWLFQQELDRALENYYNDAGLTYGKVITSLSGVQKTTQSLLQKLEELSLAELAIIIDGLNIESHEEEIYNDTDHYKTTIKHDKYKVLVKNLENISSYIPTAVSRLNKSEKCHGENNKALYQLITDVTKVARKYSKQKPEIHYYGLNKSLSGNLSIFITLILNVIFDDKYKNEISNKMIYNTVKKK